MKRITEGSAEAATIDAALAQWQQGDVALGETWFVHVGDPNAPLTDAAADSSEGGPLALQTKVEGLVVVSQTCDIVRLCALRSFVDVSPLCRPKSELVSAARRGQSTRFAILPGVADSTLVVDLERTMTVEKAIVVGWQRTRGCATDLDIRVFAGALSRKRARFAFPDAFAKMVRPMQQRLIEKHGKATPEGTALRALREIRVQASPAWQSARPAPFFWFVRGDDQVDFDGKGWDHWAEQWLGLLARSSGYGDADGAVVTLAEMNAADYVGSDPLDLAHLSE